MIQNFNFSLRDLAALADDAETKEVLELLQTQFENVMLRIHLVFQKLFKYTAVAKHPESQPDIAFSTQHRKLLSMFKLLRLLQEIKVTDADKFAKQVAQIQEAAGKVITVEPLQERTKRLKQLTGYIEKLGTLFSSDSVAIQDVKSLLKQVVFEMFSETDPQRARNLLAKLNLLFKRM